ncbi:hypothetical protein GQ53DRAFT_631900 [Thozetella sp. PMI_491]|nr:hypothetical protein GQ53DRAFT_631900 [Thozetella sp. PMI_491]
MPPSPLTTDVSVAQTESEVNSPSKEASRSMRLYGKMPARQDLLHRQLERKYYDSGDSALSDAHKSTNIGAIKTGAEHPHREGLSHPFSPVPSSGNIDANANQDIQAETHNHESNRASHLHDIASKNGEIQTVSEHTTEKMIA